MTTTPNFLSYRMLPSTIPATFRGLVHGASALALACVASTAGAWAQTPPTPAPAPTPAPTPAPAPAQQPTTKPASDASKSAAEALAKQRVKEVNLQAFKGLEEELKASLPEYSATITELSKSGIPREQWPLGPAATFYPRFEALAQQDQPDALRWCIGAMTSTGLTMDEQISRKSALYKRYVTACLDSQWTPDIITFLKNDAVPTGIGLERVLPLLDEIANGAPFVEYRTNALWTKQELCMKSTNPDHKAMGRKAIDTLAANFPNTKEGREAKGLIFRIEKLQVGMTAPEVTTTDENGVAFKLSDYRGKVTVIGFWGAWCVPCRQQLPMEREMVKRLKDKPFALLGVDTDSNKDDFKKFVAANEITWRNSWQGSTNGPWCTDWGVNRFPTYFVLDAQGVIRFVNQGGGTALGNAVDHLMEEMATGRKAPMPGETPPAPNPNPTPNPAPTPTPTPK